LNEKQDLNAEQFEIEDSRSLEEIIDELTDMGFIPSFVHLAIEKEEQVSILWSFLYQVL